MGPQGIAALGGLGDPREPRSALSHPWLHPSAGPGRPWQCRDVRVPSPGLPEDALCQVKPSAWCFPSLLFLLCAGSSPGRHPAPTPPQGSSRIPNRALRDLQKMLSASKPRAGAGCSLHLRAHSVFWDEDACLFASLRDSEHPRDPSLPGGAGICGSLGCCLAELTPKATSQDKGMLTELVLGLRTGPGLPLGPH